MGSKARWLNLDQTIVTPSTYNLYYCESDGTNPKTWSYVPPEFSFKLLQSGRHIIDPQILHTSSSEPHLIHLEYGNTFPDEQISVLTHWWRDSSWHSERINLNVVFSEYIEEMTEWDYGIRYIPMNGSETIAVIDDNNNIHIAFGIVIDILANSRYGAVYMFWDSTQKVITKCEFIYLEPLIQVNWAYALIGLCVDSNCVPHFTTFMKDYSEFGGGYTWLWHYWRSGDIWYREEVDNSRTGTLTSARCGPHTIDFDGQLRISYIDASDRTYYPQFPLFATTFYYKESGSWVKKARTLYSSFVTEYVPWRYQYKKLGNKDVSVAAVSRTNYMNTTMREVGISCGYGLTERYSSIPGSTICGPGYDHNYNHNPIMLSDRLYPDGTYTFAWSFCQHDYYTTAGTAWFGLEDYDLGTWFWPRTEEGVFPIIGGRVRMFQANIAPNGVIGALVVSNLPEWTHRFANRIKAIRADGTEVPGGVAFSKAEGYVYESSYYFDGWWSEYDGSKHIFELNLGRRSGVYDPTPETECFVEISTESEIDNTIRIHSGPQPGATFTEVLALYYIGSEYTVLINYGTSETMQEHTYIFEKDTGEFIGLG